MNAKARHRRRRRAEAAARHERNRRMQRLADHYAGLVVREKLGRSWSEGLPPLSTSWKRHGQTLYVRTYAVDYGHINNLSIRVKLAT